MITYTIETLYHFSCEKCKKWWSIGDPFWSSYKTMTCPHCGEESKLERKGITPGAGGTGGGGEGGADETDNGSPGTANTGGGGGGGTSYDGVGQSGGGNGGSGIVIIRFPSTFTIQFETSGLTYSSSTSGTDTVIQFTAGTGTISFNE